MPFLINPYILSAGGGGGGGGLETAVYWNEQSSSGSGLTNGSTGTYTATYTLTGDPVQVIVALQCKATNPSTVASVTCDGNTMTSEGAQRDGGGDDNFEIAIFTIGAQTAGSADIVVNLEDSSGSPAAQDATAGVAVFVRQGAAGTVTFDSEHITSSNTADLDYTGAASGSEIWAVTVVSALYGDFDSSTHQWSGDASKVGTDVDMSVSGNAANWSFSQGQGTGLSGTLSVTGTKGNGFHIVIAGILIEP